MKKVTLATIKAFIRKNKKHLFIAYHSSFDGMIDGLSYSKDCSFHTAKHTDHNVENTLGVDGAWFVLDSRDYFTRIERDGFVGFEIYNCCGSFDLAIKG